MNLKLLPTQGKRLVKSELIEILIPDRAVQILPRIELPDNPNLRDVYLWGIEAYCVIDTPKSIISKNNVIPMSLMKATFLTLQDYNGDNFQWQKPLIDLRTMVNNRLNLAIPDNVAPLTETNPNNYTGQIVNWSKSYIEFSDNTLIPTGQGTTSVLLEIYYSDRSAKARENDKRATFKNQS